MHFEIIKYANAKSCIVIFIRKFVYLRNTGVILGCHKNPESTLESTDKGPPLCFNIEIVIRCSSQLVTEIIMIFNNENFDNLEKRTRIK